MTGPAARYIDLLMRCLTRELFLDQEVRDVDLDRWPGDRDELLAALRPNGWRVVEHAADPDIRAVGHDWPPTAETMVGRARLHNVAECAQRVLVDGVPGDFVETGVWRGGVCILLRGILAAHEVTDRTVWVADSFEGIPEPDGDRYPADEGIDFSGIPALAVPADQVRANFERYGLLDDQVRFLEGWFEHTLPEAPIDQIALLRLDGDLYQSTMDALGALYPKVATGGYVIVDDYLAWEGCRQAVDYYRAQHGIDDQIIEIDWAGVYWRREQ
ncbi:MAG: TylF/MycF family methyltransferase [Acidimicrobiia bacterium]|nr:TylF/MycF family methyltransferase [Acidimicrobiia bacterium]